VTRTVSPGPNDFHPNDPDGIDSKLLQVLHKRNSSSGVSSLILDNGDGQQLSDKAEEREGVLFAPSSELFQTGAQFSPGSSRSIRSKISDFSDAEDHDAPPLQQPHVEAPTRDLHRTLQEAISEARLESIEKDGRFLPLDSLGSLVTLKSIEEELRQYNLADDLRTIAKDVLRIKPGTQSNDPTTRRKIFAILVMMRRSGAIVDVIKEKIWDDALPFRIGKSSQQDVHRKAQDGTTPEPIAFFRKWKIDERETFDNYQWQMTAPYFRLGFRPRKKVHHYDLEPRAVLPFVEETPKDDSLNHSVDFSGGTSTVRKLKIHSAHHDCPKELVSELKSETLRSVTKLVQPSRDTNPYFAVKTLRLREEIAKEKGKGKEVNREALALKRFVDKDHKHLIRLLATFTYKDQFNFILPCADGNLQDLWKKHYPKLSDLPRDRELARWVAGQLLGLAYAVKSIHMAPVDAPNSGNLSEEDRAKQHGRHGDLKPENILWFKDSSSQSGQSPMGVLKISDFGFADFHRTHSVNIISLSSIGGVTPTYRAPECDLAPNAPKGSSVSPAYDIWSFGCVFLEFVNWYLLGWKGVDNFSKRRKEESDSLVEEDNFFNSSDKGRTAKSKPSVAEVSL
jgi:serine/threonine protein kinase